MYQRPKCPYSYFLYALEFQLTVSILNVALIAINTIKTITIPIILYFIKTIILQSMFVNKGKINTSRFFPMLYHEESPEKTQYNMATPSFLDKSRILPYPSSPIFQQKLSDTPISIIFEKVNPSPHSEVGEGVSNYVTIFAKCSLLDV